MEGTITISKVEYLHLKICQEKLARLEGGGVDNWMHYSEALNPEGELKMREWREDEKERIEAL